MAEYVDRPQSPTIWGMDDRPFRGREATRNDLRRHYRRVFHGFYIGETTDLTAAVKARAAWLATGPRVTLAGLSAAAIHGAKWLDGRLPAEVIRADRHSPPGIVVRSDDIADDEVWLVAGMRVTSPARTAFDIGRRCPGDTAIPILDDLLNATDITPADIAAIADPPDSQIRFPELGIRVDMGWPQWKVALEYDGVQHWTDARQRTWDIERIVRLESVGWVVIRVSAEMFSRPAVIVDRVRSALRAAGCPI
jgi:hypothetical protein